MEMSFFMSDTFNLIVILFAIVVIIFLFLKMGDMKDKNKINAYYVFGLCAFIIIELITYICINNDYKTDIVSYISFAATISSLFLSVLAIIQAIISGNKGAEQYAKLDKVSDEIMKSATNISTTSNTLTEHIEYIIEELKKIEGISSDTNTKIKENLLNISATSPAEEIKSDTDINDLYKIAISDGPVMGLFSLLACAYSKKHDKEFDIKVLFDKYYLYSVGYIAASIRFGLIRIQKMGKPFTIKTTDTKYDFEQTVLKKIESLIDKKPEDADLLKKIQDYFEENS